MHTSGSTTEYTFDAPTRQKIIKSRCVCRFAITPPSIPTMLITEDYTLKFRHLDAPEPATVDTPSFQKRVLSGMEDGVEQEGGGEGYV